MQSFPPNERKIMNRPHRLAVRFRAFTLVELLVVVGIIAVLVSILMPALNKARRAANTVVCASNMRQIGLAMVMYCGEHNGCFPCAFIDVGPAPNAGGNGYSWDDMLNRYVGRKDKDADLSNQWMPNGIKLFTCPDDVWDRQVGGVTYKTRSYSMTSCLTNGTYGAVFYGMGTKTLTLTAGWPVNVNFRYVKITDAPRSSETLLLVECPYPNGSTAQSLNRLGSPSGCQVDKPSDQTNQGLIKPLHGGKWNYLFVDGHVDWLSMDQTIRTPATLTSTAPTLNYMWTRIPND